jgi:hypothetical protein
MFGHFGWVGEQTGSQEEVEVSGSLKVVEVSGSLEGN